MLEKWPLSVLELFVGVEQSTSYFCVGFVGYELSYLELLVKLWAPLCSLCVGVVAIGLGAVALSVLEEVAKEFFLLSV